MAGRRHLLAAGWARSRRLCSVCGNTTIHEQTKTQLANWPSLCQDHSDKPDTTVHIV